MLHAADGHRYVRLLAHDAARYAVLVEELGPSLESAGASPEEAIAVLCRTLREAWRVPVSTAPEPAPGEGKAEQLGRSVAGWWEQAGRPCPRPLLDRARAYAARRAAAYDPRRAVLVHGEPHPGNVLRVPAPRPGAASGYVLVDPDGLRAEPAYDLGVVLRDWCPQLLAAGPDAAELARHYCRLLAEGGGEDPAAVWEWGFLERVSTGLYLHAFGAPELAAPFLETARLLR